MFHSTAHPQEIRTEQWFDHTAYPYASHYLSVPEGKLHYIDEGEGEVLLFVHGTPAWSFLYREQIRVLSKKYRCIAPDHIGFGLSEKPQSLKGTPEAHAQNLAALIDHLNLEQFTLVVHDFGGPIGLSYAIAHPGKIKSIVMFNTWLWETAGNPSAQKADRLIHSGFGRFLYLNLNFSPKVLLKQSFKNKSALTHKAHQHYIRVFPSRKDRYGLLRMAESLVGSSAWYQKQWDHLHALDTIPKLILWGKYDPFLTRDYLGKWKERWPDAEVHLFEAGHFVQEEQPAAVTTAILAFMNNK